MQKPHRFLLNRVAGYAEEGSAFLRRRKIRSLPFARVRREGGKTEALSPGGDAARRALLAANALIAEVGRVR
jgi:hypothetical protein